MAVISVPSSIPGLSYSVKIAGDTPTPEEQARISQYVSGQDQSYYETFGGGPKSSEPDTSFMGAIRSGIDQPLENMAVTARALGGGGIGDFLSNLTAAPENYQSATEGFINEGGNFYDFTYLPRAGVEQAGQFLGSVLSRAGGAAAGATLGSVGGPAGAATGALVGGFAAPAVFRAAQLLGPVALGRAKNQGREEPNRDDWLAAIATSTASGALDAIAPNLSGILKRVLVEAGTEGLQSLIEQAGETAGTNVGLQLDLRQAGAEAIIGGTSAGIVDAPRAIMDRGKAKSQKEAAEEEERRRQLEEDQKADAEEILNRIKLGQDAMQRETQEVAISRDDQGEAVSEVAGFLPPPDRVSPVDEATLKAAQEREQEAPLSVRLVTLPQDERQALIEARTQAGVDPQADVTIDELQQVVGPKAAYREAAFAKPASTAEADPIGSTARPFNWRQYQAALEAIRANKKYSAPVIQAAVRADTKAPVPMSVVRSIRDEMVARGELRADTKSSTGYVVEPPVEVAFSPAQSYRKTLVDLETQASDFRMQREKALLDARAAEQTGKPSDARKYYQRADDLEAAIKKVDETRREAEERLKRVRQEGFIPNTERPASLVSGLTKVAPISEATPEQRGPIIVARRERLQSALAYYQNRIREQQAILKKLEGDAKKVQLPKTELVKMDKLRAGLQQDIFAADAIKSRIDNPSDDVQVGREQVAANNARMAAEQAARAKRAPIYTEREKAVFAALRKRLTSLNLPDVRLTAEMLIRPDLAREGSLVEGVYDRAKESGNRTIALSMGIYDPKLSNQQLFDRLSGVMNHEVIHALKDMNLFRAREWKALSDAAAREKYARVVDGKPVKRSYSYLDRAASLYPDADPDVVVEEAIAEMFRDYMDGKLRLSGAPRSLIQRIKDFFRSIWASHKEAGITDLNQIFEGVKSGEVGGRQRGTETEPTIEVERQSRRDDSRAAFLAGNHPLVPDVLYHGTSRDVRSFDPDAKRSYDIDPLNPDETDTGWFGKGHYFTDNPRVASHYAKEGAKRQGDQGANIVPVHVSMKNPFVVDMKAYDSGAKTLDQALTRAGVLMHPRGWRKPSEQTAALMAMGHDGVIATREGKPQEYVAFKPEQVKSALSATAFDPNSPDIRMSRLIAQNAKDDPNFQAWSQGQAIMDKDGNPKVFYTGTSKDMDFTKFKVGRHGGWFTSDPVTASNYAEENDSMGYRRDGWDIKKVNTASRVIPAFIKASNPYRGQKPARVAMEENYKRAQSQWFDTLRAQGYDAWMPESDGSGFDPNLVVVLGDPSQIKSVFAKGRDGKGDMRRYSLLRANGRYDESKVDAIERENRAKAITNMQTNGDTKDRISTRQPYTKRATEDALTQNLIIDLAAMKKSPEAFAHNMRVLKGYVGFNTPHDDPNLIAQDFIRFVEDNLTWLYQNVPAQIRNRSKLWYKGARRITENWSGQYGVPDYTVAGVLAALSPQKDWYQNVSLAERVLDIHQTFTQGNMVDFRPDVAMIEVGNRIYKKYPATLKKVLSSAYTDLDTDDERAMWLRTYDEAHNPRGYRTVSAEGDFIGEAKGKVAWGSNVEIGKAIGVLRNQSRDYTSAAMGDKHKVRNFYNNILAPDAPHGDVTIDTHAVAAALIRPLSGASAEVHHNFGSSPEKKKQPAGWVAAKSIGDSGASGTYGIYAEAYRRAAAKLGVLPRELQSITWEAVRGLFPATDKRNKGKVERVNAEWQKVSEGLQTEAEARENISRIMGGVNDPTWHGLDDPKATERAPSSYEGELAGSRLERQWRGVGGTDGGDAGGVGQSGGGAGATSRDVYAGRGRAPRGVRPRGQTRYSVLDAGRGRGDGGGGDEVRSLAPLAGAPQVEGASGPDLNLVRVAEEYARSIGIDLRRQARYADADPERGRRIAQAYDEMKHAPQDPVVKEAYQNLIDQTTAQYKALADAGYQFYFFDPQNDPYAGMKGGFGNPWNAMRDLRKNRRMAVYPTVAGYGTSADQDVAGNPMLAETGLMWHYGSPDGPLVPVLANDLFRAVHDAFGHGLEGAGFRAAGEENAFQAHIRLFTGSAKGAMASETRGQNSWLNFGPYGAKNQTASVEDTFFADQKTGIMPEWTWTEGIVPDAEPYPQAPAGNGDQGVTRQSMLSVRQSVTPSQQLQKKVQSNQSALMYARSSDLIAKVLNLRGHGIEAKKARRISDGILRRFQDNMLPVGRMIQELSKNGMTITDAMDPYLQEELMHGVVGHRIAVNQKTLYTPVVEAVKRINVPKGKIEELIRVSTRAAGGTGYVAMAMENSDSPRMVLADAYLYAKHARERNRYIQSTKDAENQTGSAMSDAEAEAILRWFETLDPANKAAVKDMALGVRKIVDDTNRTRVEAGLISQDVVDENPFRFYVPLRGIMGETDPDEEFAGPPSRPRFGASGREDRRALGRYDYATDILANLFTQNQNAILRGERNKVGQSFLKLLRADTGRTEGYARILPTAPTMRASVDGKIRNVPDPRAKDDPNILVVKEDGKQVYVEFSDARLAGALNGRNGLSPGNGSVILNAMNKVNRYLASINTSYNPEFMVSNMIRDLQTAGVNVSQFEQAGLSRSVMAGVPKALAGVKRAIINGDETSEWSKVYKDYVEAGGQNATNQFNSLADEMQNIQSMLGDISDAGMRGNWNAVKNGFIGKGVGSLLHLVENYNTVIENGVRVATYKALLDRGFTKQRAAQAARNVTVNFAKGGDYRRLMGAWYLFYNASLQGSFALLNAAVRSPKVRTMWAAVIAAGVLQDQLNAAISGMEDDDEDRLIYDKIPEYILEHNFVLMDPTGISERGYIAIPMPYGLNMAHNAGRAMSRAARGGYSASEATSSIVGTAVDALNPVGGTESWANAVAPTVADPFIDVIQNENFAGLSIYKENMPFDKTPQPNSQLYWQTTSPSAVWVARNLNELTGGNSVRPGLVDWSPDIIEFWFDYITGGVGRFAQRTAELPFKATETGLTEELARDVPFVRRVIGSVSSREDTGEYIEMAKRVLMAKEEYKKATEAGDRDWATSVREKSSNELRLVGLVNSTEAALRKISQTRNQIMANTRIPDDQKRLLLQRLDERKQMILKRANATLYRGLAGAGG